MKDVMDMADSVIMPTYRRIPIVFERGEGMYLFSKDGRKYLDLSSGIGVNSLGYSANNVKEAFTTQLGKLIHTSNLFYTEPMADLARKLVKLFGKPGSKVFFCNSGAESVEAAMKLAKRFQKIIMHKEEAYEFISFKNSFHGRTLATITLTGQKKYQTDFLPLIDGVRYAIFNDIASVKRLINDQTAAVIVEVVQGEGGVNVAQKGFLKGLRDLCDEHGVILIFDEIQTGVGRTGRFFAFENYGVMPDIVTLAKALGGGLPIGATIASPKYADVLQPGTHASTFGANPVVAAGAAVVVETVSKEAFLSAVRRKGRLFISELQRIRSKKIKEIHGLGLMIGIDFYGISAGDVLLKLLEKSIISLTAGENVLRLLPPLIISDDQIKYAAACISDVLQ